MTAGVNQFVIEQYTMFLVMLTYTYLNGPNAGQPVDLTNYQAQMDFSAAFPLPNQTPPPSLYTMATGDAYGQITFPNPLLGQIQLYIPAARTPLIILPNWQGVYVLMLKPPNTIQPDDPFRLLQGPARISPGVQPFQMQS